MTTGRNEFSVYYWMMDVQQEECRFVSAETAADKFKFLATGVTARVGMLSRVIITDGGDCTVAEWKYGEGVVWPKKEDIR